MDEAGAISEQRSHFRICRSQTLLILKHRLFAGSKIDDDINQVADHDRPLTTCVIWLAVFDALGQSGSHERGRGICNECKVTYGCCISDHDRGAGRIWRLPYDGSDDRPFALSWPKRIEWPEDDDWYAERFRKSPCHHVRGYFGSGIRRLSLQRMSFIDRHCYGCAVDLAGRRVNDPLGAALPRGLEHIQSAEHVCFDIGLRSDVRNRGSRSVPRDERRFRGRVRDDDESRIADVAANQVDFLSGQIRKVVQPTMAIRRNCTGQER